MKACSKVAKTQISHDLLMANFLEVFRSKSGALIPFPVKLLDVPENEVKIVDFGHSLVLVSYFRPLINPPKKNLFSKPVNFFLRNDVQF